MKFKFHLTNEQIYGLIYYAIAVATAKHSAWAYSSTMEGLQPALDWAKFNGSFADFWSLLGLGVWFMWGLLAAIAVDVGMFTVAKNIRESQNRNLLGMYLTYAMVALISAYFQVMYSLQHASAFTPVEGVPLWVNTAYVWRFLIVPVSLPLMSVGYTLFVKLDVHKNKPVLGKVDKEIGEKTFTVDEAAAYTGYSPAAIRQKGYAAERQVGIVPAFGYRDENGKMMFKKSELDPIKKGS